VREETVVWFTSRLAARNPPEVLLAAAGNGEHDDPTATNNMCRAATEAAVHRLG
jgi:hypothetical protein